MALRPTFWFWQLNGTIEADSETPEPFQWNIDTPFDREKYITDQHKSIFFNYLYTQIVSKGKYAVMPKYIFSFEGREHESKIVEFDTLDEARNDAVRYLGAYLSEHPGFSNEGHWRVNVDNDTNQHLLHVIVATVPSRYTRDMKSLSPTS